MYRETLVSPDGRAVTATSPAEYNDLRYGRGYRPVDDPAVTPGYKTVPNETGKPERVEQPTGSVREDDAPADDE